MELTKEERARLQALSEDLLNTNTLIRQIMRGGFERGNEGSQDTRRDLLEMQLGDALARVHVMIDAGDIVARAVRHWSKERLTALGASTKRFDRKAVV